MTEAQFVERLRKHHEQDLPFVAYRKPGAEQVQAYLQQNDQTFFSEDFTEKGFVFAPFDDRDQNILVPDEASEKIIFKPSEMISDDEKLPVDTSSEVNSTTREKHVSLVEKALGKLKSGELEKVVLTRREEINLPEADPVDLFRRLLKTYPTAFVYLWYHPATKCWLAATPETLLRVDGNNFSTMALAGTQKFEGSTDVSWGEKEKQEQLFVTESILQNLEKAGISPGGIKKSDVYTAKAGNLLHLKTDISGRLNYPKNNLKNVISALHPTPAVCGLPKEKAKEFIFAEEGYDREFYTGFLGELNLQRNLQRSRNKRNVENLAYRAVKQETSLFVNLRCMKMDGNTISIYVGGGITKDSDPVAEWEETVNKSQTMKKVLFK
jgi:isochorismate synthase